MTDPIYAALDAHRAAYQHWSDAVDVEAVLVPGDPTLPAAEAESQRRSDIKQDLLRNLHAVPTTIEGVAALAEYYVELHKRNESELSRSVLLKALTNIARALRGMA